MRLRHIYPATRAVLPLQFFGTRAAKFARAHKAHGSRGSRDFLLLPFFLNLSWRYFGSVLASAKAYTGLYSSGAYRSI